MFTREQEELIIRLNNIALEQCNRGCMHCGLSTTPILPALSYDTIVKAVEMFPSNNLGGIDTNNNRRTIYFNTGETLCWISTHNEEPVYIGDLINTIAHLSEDLYFSITTSGVDITSKAERNALTSIARLEASIKARIKFVLSITPFAIMKNQQSLTFDMLNFLIENEFEMSLNCMGNIDIDVLIEFCKKQIKNQRTRKSAFDLIDMLTKIKERQKKDIDLTEFLGNYGNWAILHGTYGRIEHFVSPMCLKPGNDKSVEVMLVALDNATHGFAVSCNTWIAPFLIVHPKNVIPSTYQELVSAVSQTKSKLEQALAASKVKFADGEKVCTFCAATVPYLRNQKRLERVAGENFCAAVRRIRSQRVQTN